MELTYKKPVFLSVRFAWLVHWWCLPIVLAVFALLLLSASYVWPFPYVGATWYWSTGKVTQLYDNSPAARLGLSVGDVIQTVDGVPRERAYQLLSGKEVGEEALLTWQHEGSEQQGILVMVEKPRLVRWGEIVPLVIGLSLSVIGMVVLALRPTIMAAQFFFLLNQLGGAILAAGLLSEHGSDKGRWLCRLFIYAFALFFVHFHTLFPLPAPRAIMRGLLIIFYTAAGVLALPLILWPKLALHGAWAASLGHEMISLAYLSLAWAVGMLLLYRGYFCCSTPLSRQRSRILFFGTFLGFIPMLGFSLIPYLLFKEFFLSFELSFLGFLLVPLSYGVAIHQHNLFETDRMLNRSMVVILLGLGWAFAYLFLNMLLAYLMPRQIATEPIVGALLVILMVALSGALQPKIQSLVDRLFYRESYNERDVIGNFSQALRVIFKREALAALLARQLPQKLRISQATLLWNEGESLIPLSSAHYSALASSGGLARFMQVHCQPISTWQLLQEDILSLTAEERHLCEVSQLCVPLGCQRQLFGLLFLGRKLADDSYTEADHHILSTLAIQAAMTAHNVSLVEALEERLAQIEESRRELEEASHRLLVVREQERKSLARDLHDGAIQKLSQLGAQLDKTIQEIDNPALLTALQEIRAKSGKSLNELRGLCDDLRVPEVEFFGLAIAIECDAEELTGTATVELDLIPDKNKLSLEASIALYHIYQAAITNALVHAQAQEIKVCLHFSEQTAKLSIQDDGQGFVVPECLTTLTHHKHFGLVGMQERAWALGGELTIDSTLGVGTTISASIPLERNKK